MDQAVLETVEAADVPPETQPPAPVPKPGAVVERRNNKPKKFPYVVNVVDTFIADMEEHPDAKILGLDQYGKPTRADQFQDTAMLKQRIVTIRVLIRE